MSAQTRSILDLVDILIREGLSPETSLRVSKEIDVAYGLTTARSSGSSDRQREKWRLKKARQRLRRGAADAFSPRGHSQSGNTEVIVPYLVEGTQEVSKSDLSASPGTRGTKPKREPRSKGDVLPDDWSPSDKHYELGAELGFDRRYVDGLAGRMRDWAVANAHRAVARKAGVKGWNAAFSNWMKSHHEKQQGGSNASNRNGHAAARPGGSYSTLAAKVRAGRRQRDAAGGEQDHGPSDPERGFQFVDGDR